MIRLLVIYCNDRKSVRLLFLSRPPQEPSRCSCQTLEPGGQIIRLAGDRSDYLSFIGLPGGRSNEQGEGPARSVVREDLVP
jgi:hypothetical protein